MPIILDLRKNATCAEDLAFSAAIGTWHSTSRICELYDWA